MDFVIKINLFSKLLNLGLIMKNLTFIYAALILLALLGCSEKYPVSESDDISKDVGDGCNVCHLDKELLQEVATPIPSPENGQSGEG